MKLILSSTSFRRRQILSSIGIEFDLFSPVVDETAFLSSPYEEAVERVAIEKAKAYGDVKDVVVLGADTVVVVGDTVLGKPVDVEDAKKMLRFLSGREHKVVTGIAIYYNGNVYSDREITIVRFTKMTEKDINFYIATGEPMDKAGAYAIQGYGSMFIEYIRGCYFNVVGLPVFRLRCLFQRAGMDLIDFCKRGNQS